MNAFLLIAAMAAMFASGLVLWDVFDLAWDYFRAVEFIHSVGALLLVLVVLGPYVYRHVREYHVVKKVRSLDGMMLTLLLFLVLFSGIYLFFVGNRGGDAIGQIAFWLHLYGSFVLLALFALHIIAKKLSAPPPAAAVLCLAAILSSVPSYGFDHTMTHLKLGDGASRYHDETWTNSAKCKTCHGEIFKQWADSNHRHMAGSNPYYMTIEALAGEIEGDNFRQWCMGCHNPSALTTGLTRTTHAMEGNVVSPDLIAGGSKRLIDSFREEGNHRLEEGVSCLTCHRVSDANATGNASYAVDLNNRKKYLFEESDTAAGRWLGEKMINAKPDVHKKSYMLPLYKESRYCASCHDESSPQNGIAIVSTFKEWERSPYNRPDDPSKHKSCIDCHMTRLENGDYAPLHGYSTDGGALKKDVKVHYFAGSNHFLSGLKSREHEDQTIQLLRRAAELDVRFAGGKLAVGVKNAGAGHHLPTGVADFRELWLDVSVEDAAGRTLFSSGKLGPDGNLGDDARKFMKVFGDENGEPVGLLFWKYRTMISDTRIPAGERREELYDVTIPPDAAYPLHVTVKLNFRIYPQWVTDAVKKLFPLLSDPPVVELARIVSDIEK